MINAEYAFVGVSASKPTLIIVVLRKVRFGSEYKPLTSKEPIYFSIKEHAARVRARARFAAPS